MPASVQSVIDRANTYILPVYARPPLVLSHGKGAYVWDTQGRKYLDFSAGIAVNALGHADEGVAQVSLTLRLVRCHVVSRAVGFCRRRYLLSRTQMTGSGTVIVVFSPTCDLRFGHECDVLSLLTTVRLHKTTN